MKRWMPIVLLLVCTSCTQESSVTTEWGIRGSVLGRFSSPRGIAVDRDYVYVIDRTGRVQKFDREGKALLEWSFEEIKNGTPTGLVVDDDGTLWIADTHYSRILHYSPQGKLLSKFGEYGEEAGKFVFTTDIAIGSDGNLYISEYGVHDRIQVFTKQGEYLRHWGDFGDQPDQMNRPMAIVNMGGGRLAVADAANHRIKLYRENGELISMFGEKGKQTGAFVYPYDLDVDEEGNICTIEFGMHRIQKWTSKGEWIASWGSVGSGPENLGEPWGLAVWGDRLYAADTKNHRILVVPTRVF